MKKLLVLAAMFLVGTAAQANQVTDLDHGNYKGIRYNHAQSITFVQKGIQFFVYSNGEFDFQPIGNTIYGRRNARRFNAPGSTFGVTFPNRINRLVRYDYWGNIDKVGRNHIFYNRRGKVKHIGNITMRYHRGRLVRVGNMSLFYNRLGQIIDVQGFIHNHDNRYQAGLVWNRGLNDDLDQWGRRDAELDHKNRKKHKKRKFD